MPRQRSGSPGACGAVGGVIHPAILQSVITGSGWRQAFVVMGAMALVGDRPSPLDWAGFVLVLGGAGLVVVRLGR